jgi:predicted PurR-regulated permease PerM
LNIALDVAIRITVIGVIVLSCLKIFSPFLLAVVWGITMAIALYPVFSGIKKAVGQRNRLAGSLFILISLTIVLVPTFLLTESLVDGSVELVHRLESGTLVIPPPPEDVQTWPVIGESVYKTWLSASVDMAATAAKLAPQLAELGSKLASALAGVGGAVVHTVFALIIAGILMMTSQGGSRAAHAVARRLAGEHGPAMVDLSSDTIRSVVKGVILVALIQGLMSAVGLWVAGVPGVGLWALLVMVVAVIQLPPILILGPIAAWVFSANDNTVIAVGFLIWSLIVSGSDSFLKPMFLGRGVQVPMLVILIGAIGGMLQSGVLGLFIGPVILSIGYTLFTAWVAEEGLIPKPQANSAEAGD